MLFQPLIVDLTELHELNVTSKCLITQTKDKLLLLHLKASKLNHYSEHSEVNLCLFNGYIFVIDEFITGCLGNDSNCFMIRSSVNHKGLLSNRLIIFPHPSPSMPL